MPLEQQMLSGACFIVDNSGGFSAVAAEFLENIYTNTPVLLYAVRGPGSHMSLRSRKQTVFKELHDAVSFSRLAPFSKLIVPVGLPFLSTMEIIPTNQMHSCALICLLQSKTYNMVFYAAALHSTRIPFRMEPVGPSADSGDVSGAMDVNGLIQMLAGQARQNIVAILDVSMPAPALAGIIPGEQSLFGSLQSLTPDVAQGVEDLQTVESMTIHGALGSGGHYASVPEVKNAVHAIPVSGSSSRGSLDVHSVPMAVRLRSSSTVLPYIENRLGNLRRFGIERGAPGAELLRSWGFGKDELDDMEETLSKKSKFPKPDLSKSKCDVDEVSSFDKRRESPPGTGLVLTVQVLERQETGIVKLSLWFPMLVAFVTIGE
ncbi:hypothetical protein EZV62_006884 [Acer yangbiense]|uniref:DML1/Misato tubulin domain-containing protein n=1 Tax=Acer yangbiense TaxID=1000413 RepID=A0A5C7IA33_9ROSI|nr:hypothetical protein EZV62_006884 [Acer yangbiense]